MEKYKAAYYQQDTISELRNQAEVFFYGPGFPGYSQTDKIADVLAKAPFNPDCIVTGHSWLSEWPGEVTPWLEIDNRNLDIPLVGILNKEYNNLERKLTYFAQAEFDLIFTHHHDSQDYAKRTNTQVIFWPFAFSKARIPNYNNHRNIDIMFSGILHNRGQEAIQTTGRLKVMRTLFHCIGDLPVKRRNHYSNYKIMWNGMPRTRSRDSKAVSYMLMRLFFPKYSYNHIPSSTYFEALAKSRLVIGTLSPAGLIGPRYFETMAAGGLVFCEESTLYSNIFPSTVYVSYRSDLSDFSEKLCWYLENESARRELADNGRDFVMGHHKWSDRIQTMLSEIEKII